MMLLNKYLQYYHFSEKHEIKISASKENIAQAIIDLHPNEISFLFSTLFFIRSIPPKILGKNYIGFSPDTPLLKQLEEKGFKILEINDHEIVLGVIGQFGKLKKGEIYYIDDFINFNERESVKVATNFFLVEREDIVLLSTETRIYNTDKKSKRRFTVYWMIVYPGSALIRKIWLKAIKRRSERTTSLCV